MKLKENFFDSEEMIILQNMPDGYLYSDILMKLYLRSLKNEGKLMFRDLIPNIQVSWVKMGFRFAQVSLTAGANDLGGTLGGDELSEASGAPDGVDASISTLSRMVKDLGRNPIERNSKYTEFYPID